MHRYQPAVVLSTFFDSDHRDCKFSPQHVNPPSSKDYCSLAVWHPIATGCCFAVGGQGGDWCDRIFVSGGQQRAAYIIQGRACVDDFDSVNMSRLDFVYVYTEEIS